MKKAFFTSLVSIVPFVVSFTSSPGTLVGRWQQKIRNGAMMQVNFRPDSSYNLSINGKYVLGGKYYVKNDTVGITDGGCNINYYGIYKLNFFAQDSVRWNVVQDTCAGRRRGYDKGVLGRVKPDMITPSK